MIGARWSINDLNGRGGWCELGVSMARMAAKVGAKWIVVALPAEHNELDT